MTNNMQEVKRINPNESIREQVTLGEFHKDWLTFPNQRPHEKNARDPKWYNKMLRPQQDHYEVKGVIFGCDIVNPINPNQIFKKGDKMKTDGHTTAEFFAVVCKEIGREDLIPKNLNVTHHTVYTWEELQDAFNVYDNNASVFKGSDKFFGAIRINNFTLSNFNAVQSISSLEYAASFCYPNYYEKSKTSSNDVANRMMKDVGEGFVWLDKVISDKKFGNKILLKPSLKCTYVMSYMLYRDDEDALAKLKQFVLNVSGKKINTLVNNVDSCTFFIQKWEEIVNKEHGLIYDSNLNRSVRCTNAISFALKMIDDYIKGISRKQMPDSTTIGKYMENWQNKFILTENALSKAFNVQPV